MPLGTLLAAAILASPQEHEEPSIQEELEALIEKTNALDSFQAIYDMRSTSEGSLREATFEFVHRAPDLGHFRLSGDDFHSEIWVDEERYYSSSAMGSGDGEWRVADFPEPPAAVLLLNELFPRAERALGPGVRFDLLLRNSAGETHLSPSIGRTLVRPCVLGWLERMQNRLADVSREEDGLVLEEDGCRYRVSRENGFLVGAEITTADGEIEIIQRECHLDEPLAEELVEIPFEAGLGRLDPDLTSVFEMCLAPGYLRNEAFLRVERVLASGTRSWNERTSKDWHTVLEALHRAAIEGHCSGWLEEQQKCIARLVEWVRAQRTRDDSSERLDEVAKQVAPKRSAMEKSLTSARTAYVDSLPAIESATVEPRQELFDVELEVIDALWSELLSRPVLESFDQQLDEALER